MSVFDKLSLKFNTIRASWPITEIDLLDECRLSLSTIGVGGACKLYSLQPFRNLGEAYALG